MEKRNKSSKRNKRNKRNKRWKKKVMSTKPNLRGRMVLRAKQMAETLS